VEGPAGVTVDVERRGEGRMRAGDDVERAGGTVQKPQKGSARRERRKAEPRDVDEIGSTSYGKEGMEKNTEGRMKRTFFVPSSCLFAPPSGRSTGEKRGRRRRWQRQRRVQGSGGHSSSHWRKRGGRKGASSGGRCREERAFFSPSTRRFAAATRGTVRQRRRQSTALVSSKSPRER
jgi:hypothetical protein